METNANTDIPASNAAPAMLVPRADYCLAQLSDSDLLANTRRLVGSSNQLFAALLAHLAEVEVRGVHRSRACSSLYTYCLYELRMSEDAAFRRATAAKLVKRFPALFDSPARKMTTNASPGWQDFVQSMVPVRELAPGDRPRDWTAAPRRMRDETRTPRPGSR